MSEILKNSFNNGLIVIEFRKVLAVDGDIKTLKGKEVQEIYVHLTSSLCIRLHSTEAVMFIKLYTAYLKRLEQFDDEFKMY